MSKLKKRAPIKPGKKTIAWNNERRKLKAEFEAMGVAYCEACIDPFKCWGTQGLGFAHSKKRRKLKKGELSRVILACNYCHDILDNKMDAQEMEDFIDQVIESRKSRIDNPTHFP